MENIPFDSEAQIRRVKNVIARELTDWQQTVIRETYFGGKTQSQIARIYGVHRSNVCRALHRAETRLRKFLAYYA